jgi:hypothetical protein
LGRGREEPFLVVELSFILMVGIEVGPETDFIGVSGRTIVGTVIGETVIVGIEGGVAPFIWIAGESGR